MSTTTSQDTRSENAETTAAWDGPLFDRFVQFREIMTTGLGAFGTMALELAPPARGARVLDVGCGFGDATQEIAALVGPSGSVVGVDVAPRFVAESAEDAARAGVTNVRFAVADVQTSDLGGPYDLAFSRFGTMFFANPVAALRNVRRSLVPGGRLVMVVWRAKIENEWMYRAQQIVERFVTKPDEYDEPTCGPGPFSMAGADTTSGILVASGYTDIALHRRDRPVMIGRDIEEAVSLAMSLGPAGEIIRLAGDRAAHLHEPIDTALREGLAVYQDANGQIRAPASVWIVTATATST
jgi:ubiquinone/menaquinone biosynthesis C-methylase UbiE